MRAAVDCGTNSTRMLIMDDTGHVVARELRITRLGENVDSRRSLTQAAIDRTVAALADFRKICDEFEVGHIRAVTTSAARDAVNSHEFLDEAAQALGAEVELISGEEEGRLTYAGASAGQDGGPQLIVDIGGGSTEFVLGDSTGVLGVRSIDTGCVRLTEQYIRSDPPRPSQLTDALAVVDEWLTEVGTQLPIAVLRPSLVGVAGTITTLASLDLGLETYDHDRIHGHCLARETVEGMFRSLAAMTVAERQIEPVLVPGRADVIVAGIVILLAVMRRFDFHYCKVSDCDILDGIAAGSR